MTFTEVCALLVREPFNMRLADIARLTDYQVAKILFHPRDEDGRLERPPPPRPKSDPGATRAPPLPEEVRQSAEAAGLEHYLPLWWTVWHERGLTAAELATRWHEYLEQRKGP